MTELISIEYYKYFPVLDYLPLSETERKVVALVLSFGERKEAKGKKTKGLCLSNEAIGKIINRSSHTVKKAMTKLRKKGLITAVNQMSRHRIIQPGNPESYLTSLGGQVEDDVLDHFRNLLDQYSGQLLDRPERSTEVKKEYIKKGETDFTGVESTTIDADTVQLPEWTDENITAFEIQLEKDTREKNRTDRHRLEYLETINNPKQDELNEKRLLIRQREANPNRYD